MVTIAERQPGRVQRKHYGYRVHTPAFHLGLLSLAVILQLKFSNWVIDSCYFFIDKRKGRFCYVATLLRQIQVQGLRLDFSILNILKNTVGVHSDMLYNHYTYKDNKCYNINNKISIIIL